MLPYLWKTCSKCLSISGGELQGCLMRGKVSEKLPVSSRIDPATVRRWRDRFRATGEVKDCKTQGDIGKTSRNVYRILKVQLFWCDPESIKYPELCYFTFILSQGIKSKLTLQRKMTKHTELFFMKSVFEVKHFFLVEAKLFWASLHLVHLQNHSSFPTHLIMLFLRLNHVISETIDLFPLIPWKYLECGL